MTTIDKLLEKYWAGETTLSEETELRTYFSGSEIAESHLPFVEAFAYQNEIATAVLPDDFEAEILKEISNQEKTAVIKPINGYRKLMAIAAAILFLLTAGFFLLKTPTPSNELADACLPDRQVPHLIINGKVYYPSSEEEAYELTKQALLLVSSKMNKESKASLKSLKELKNIHPTSWGK